MKALRNGVGVLGIILAMAGQAFATGGGLIDSHDVTQNNVNQNINQATGGAGGAGGAGGQGGTGGVGIGIGGQGGAGGTGIGLGGSAIGNKQGQAQGQQQGQKQQQGQAQGQRQGIKDSGNSTVTVTGDSYSYEEVRQAPAVFAPNLAVAPETCMGSISTGGSAAFSGAGFGLTFGTTWKSDSCERRMNARALSALGPQYQVAALALLAQDDSIRKALTDAGVSVPGQRAAAVVPGAVKKEKKDEPASAYTDNRAVTEPVTSLQTALFNLGMAGAVQGL